MRDPVVRIIVIMPMVMSVRGVIPGAEGAAQWALLPAVEAFSIGDHAGRGEDSHRTAS